MIIEKTHMKTKKYFTLVFAFLLILVIPGAIYLISLNYSAIYHIPEINQGVLDLKDYTLNGKHIPLQGQWEYFPNQWIVTDREEAEDSNQYINLPTSWMTDQGLEEKGYVNTYYGSYRIKVINANSDLNLSVSLQDIPCAWRLYANGQLIAFSGKSSKNPKEVEVSRIDEKRQFGFSQEGNEDLVLEISQTENRIGLARVPFLALSGHIINYDKTKLLMAGVFLGIYAIILVFLLLAIGISRDRRGIITFLLMMLFIFLKVSTNVDFGVFTVGDEIIYKYPWFQFIMESAMIFVPILYIIVVESLLHIEHNEKLFRKLSCFSVGSVLLSGILFFLNFKYLFLVFSILSFSTYFFVLIFISKVYLKYEKDALLILWAYSFLFMGYAIDFLFIGGLLIFRMVFFFPLTAVFFLILNVVVYMKRGEKIQNEALRLAKVEAENKDIEAKLMLAQIQPHFLYNALTAILMMIRKDPEKAERALLEFAVFLRRNMTSLGNKNPISFDEAFDHIKNYVAIEELRMGDRLKMVYEIGTKDFTVPTLTVQPIVENAIKYGPGKKVEGGTVSLKTFEKEDAYIIEVKDDGNGFDTSILEGESERSLGIRNVRMRLESLVNGKLEISSTIGKGTTVKIIIPKREK